MYAIKNKKTGKWVYGTDFTTIPYRQRTAFDIALLFNEFQYAKVEFERRKCSKNYVIVKTELKEVD